MVKGDLVLVPFPFTDLTGNKFRPALVLISSKTEVTVVFITTQLKWEEESDLLIKPSSHNGLKKESLIRLSKIATLDQNLILGRLGSLGIQDISKVNQKLKKLLELD